MLPNLLSCLSSLLRKDHYIIFCAIFTAILSMTDKVSMSSISRISGIAYRNIQRFYSRRYDWDKLRFSLYNSFTAPSTTTANGGEILLSIDEVVEDKSGRHTFGLGRFYGGLYQKVVKGIAVLQISAYHTDTGMSYPLVVCQMHKNETDQKRSQSRKAYLKDLKARKAAAKSKGIAFKGKPKGRKKGSKNQAKTEQDDSMLLRHTKLLLQTLMNLFALFNRKQPKYLVGDGAFGNQYYVQLASKYQLHLISKLKKNAKLILPFAGTHPKGKRGPKTKFGQTIDYQNISKQYLKEQKYDAFTKTSIHIYQLKVYNEVSKELINVVIIQQIDKKGLLKNNIVLFSTDTKLSYQQLRKYYQSRFPIEIDFRDAKQFFGLRHFKNIKKNQVTNAINIAMTAKLIAQVVTQHLEKEHGYQNASIIDIKTYFRNEYYAQKFIKHKQANPNQLLIPENIIKMAQNEFINLKNTA